MNSGLKLKWLEALRSGGYKQGRGVLKRCDLSAYCCFGVLCDIAPEVSWIESDEETIGYATYKNDSILEDDCYNLPISFRKEIGISDAAEQILIDKNDRGVPFPVIADWIEVEL